MYAQPCQFVCNSTCNLNMPSEQLGSEFRDVIVVLATVSLSAKLFCVCLFLLFLSVVFVVVVFLPYN